MGICTTEIDAIEYDDDVLECIVEHENNFRTRIFEIILDNRGNQHGGVFHTGDPITIDFEDTENFKGYVENVFTDDIDGYVNRMVVKLTGVCYGAALARLYMTGDYPTAAITKVDDIFDDALDKAQVDVAAPDKLIYASASAGPVSEYKARRTFLQKMYRELAEREDWDGYVDKVKTIHFFAIGDAGAHEAVDLLEDSESITNNILNLSEGEEIGDQIKNYCELYAGEVKNHWTNGGTADWTPGFNCTISDEYTIKMPGSISSLKLVRSNAGDHFLELAFPEYNYTSLDLSVEHENTIWVLHDDDDGVANIRPRLKDGNGNIVEWVKTPIITADPGATEDIPADGYFHQIKFPTGEGLTVKAVAITGFWWLHTNVTGTFDWTDVVSIGFNVVLIAGDCNVYFDYLHLPGVEVVSIAESVVSQTAYLIRKHRDHRPNVVSQRELDNEVDSYILKHKNPIELLFVWATGQKTILYASKSLDVRAPNHGINALTKYRIKRLKHHAKVGGVPGYPGEDYVTYFELIKHTVAAVDQSLSARRLDMSMRPGTEMLNAVRDFMDSMGETALPYAGDNYYARIPDTNEYDTVFYGAIADIPATGEDGWLYWATDQDIWYGWNIVDADNDWDELTRAEARIRLAQLSETDHDSLTDVTSGKHHAMSHKARHETVAGADPLDTVSDGSHVHVIGETTNKWLIISTDTLWAASVSGGATTSSFYAATAIGQYDVLIGPVTASGSHDHNVTSSPSPDILDAEDGEEMIIFQEDKVLSDGRRYVEVVYPEFDLIHQVTHPVGSTDERVIKDAKYHYHRLFDMVNEGLQLGKVKTESLFGRRLKWDRDAEKDYMDAKAAEPGDSERRAIAEGQKMKALFDE